MKPFGVGDISGPRRSNKGLKSKWFKTYFIILSLIGLVILTGYYFTLRSSYYGLAEEMMTGRLVEFTSFYNDYMDSNMEMSHSLAEKIAKDFKYEDIMRLQVLDEKGVIIASSNYISNVKDPITYREDVEHALKGENTTSIYTHEITQEKIMAASSPLKYNEAIIGIVRYTTSLEYIDTYIYKKTLGAAIVLLGALSIFFGMIWLFVSRIIKDLKEMEETTKEIAELKFDRTIDITREDEIGVLASTINYMSDTLQKSLNLKEEFIASITHDIRTPLSTIHGWSELALAQESPEEEFAKEAFQIIYRESGRLNHLVENLLDFSKLNAGQMILNKQPRHINELLTEVYELFKPKITRYHIDFSMDLNPVPLMKLDGDKIKQALVNIIDNSIQYGDVGNQLLAKTYSDKGKVTLVISDKGVGMENEEISKITDKFYSINPSKGGSGLGLAITKEIVERHGGKLEITSQLGVGTTVTMTF